MRVASLVLACLAPALASATSVPPRELEDMVKDSDHVLLATVSKVDMVDRDGDPVTDRNARTGPGIENQIRFHLEVKEVLFSTAKPAPKQVVVPLWKFWHYSLGNIQDAVTGHTGIFLLKGADFEPAWPQHFERSVEERRKIEAILKQRD
jgi:hypothetical protein